MEEIWHFVKGYDSVEASNLGEIKWRGKICKKYINPHGYECIYLGRSGNKNIIKRVHRIICSAFYGESDLDVNHINGIKTDNRLSNLEYCTKSYNQRHSFNLGLNRANIKKGGTAPFLYKKVSQYTLNMEFIKEFHSISFASECTGISSSDISSVKNGKRKTAGGFIWKS